MRNDTLLPASAAIVRVIVRVGFATVGNIAVTIAKRGLAIGNAANSSLADGSSVGLVFADVAAGIAVVDANIQVCLATIGHIGVAITKAWGTGDATCACATSRSAIRAVASGRASAAMRGRRLQIGFTPV